MSATIIPFARPAATVAAQLLTVSASERQEAAQWACRQGAAWHVETIPTDGAAVALGICPPRCQEGAEEAAGSALPWILERVSEGVALLQDGWQEHGIFPSVADALACVLEAEEVSTRPAVR